MSENFNFSHNSVFEFFRTIHCIEQVSRTLIEKELPNEMKISHLNVLGFLVNKGDGYNPADIANILEVTRPSMTNTLQKLSNKNYITIKVDPNDGRAKKVYLNEMGRKVFVQSLKHITPLTSELYENVGESFFIDTSLLLKQLHEYLNEMR